jgi:hypothetical protein
MLRLSRVFVQADRRTRHHMMLDGEINPREWFNWHPREFLPKYHDLNKFLYERHEWAHVHHLLCHQVYAKDLQRLASCPEPHTHIIDCRMDPGRMHRWIPGSVWLPRDEIEYALQLSNEEFAEMYAFPKPQVHEDVILVSHDGLAAEQAGWEFRKSFYHHVYNFRAGTNDLFAESYTDFASLGQKLQPWKGPFPQSGIYVDDFSKRKVLTRTGPFDRRYEMQDFSLPDLELEKARNPEGARQNMPYGLQ